MNTDSLIEEAIERIDRSKENGIKYSDVWCVLDRDSFPEQNYNRAFQLAASEGIKVAWANEAFELWYILHFDYLCTGLSRNQYKHKLKERGLDYDKADKDIYNRLLGRQLTALKNAQRLEAHWRQSGRNFPERENPSTSVHQLVDALNELAALPPVN